MSEEDKTFLQNALNLTPQKAEETIKNGSLFNTIKEIVGELVEVHKVNFDTADKTFKALVYETATRYPKDALKFRSNFIKYLANNVLVKDRFPLYLNFLKLHRNDPEFNAEVFEADCGVGISFTKEDTIREVKLFLDNYEDFQKNGWKFNIGKALAAVKSTLKFANGNDVKQAIDDEVLSRLGPKPADLNAQKKAEKKVESKPANNNNNNNNNVKVEVKENIVVDPETFYDTLPDSVQFHDPKDNVQARPELLEAHLKATGGKVLTRFPPEPNGYLHIGHAKSMNLNFGYAKKKGGNCYMRFDDTNPEKEKQEYIDSILHNVEWLGHKPFKVTYSSDYFEELYQFAIKLIKMDKAFVCHETSEEMRANRKAKIESKWRNRPIEESLSLFHDMRCGKFAEGKATLRMKGDMQNDNPNMRDLVAYRIKYKAHPHSGDKWCVYPSYDFTHCIIDSLENITHSLCTTEFDSRRESYNWLVNQLDLYLPPQIEFSRLNLTHHVMSKRKLTILVDENIVSGWNDPRLPTIEGLRRRGYTPRSINLFCNEIGITRNANLIKLGVLEECLRNDLNTKAKRFMAVLDPIKVTLVNFGEEEKELSVPNIPSLKIENPSPSDFHSVFISNVIYIERDDFRELSNKNFYRLAPGQNVGLKYFTDGNIKLLEIIKDNTGKVVELKAEVVPKEKVKSHISWVSSRRSESPNKIEVRLYDNLFTVEDVAAVGKRFREFVNPNSLQIITALVDTALAETKDDHVQFERLGYFFRDFDSTPSHPVWNRTVSLHEDKTKV